MTRPIALSLCFTLLFPLWRIVTLWDWFMSLRSHVSRHWSLFLMSSSLRGQFNQVPYIRIIPLNFLESTFSSSPPSNLALNPLLPIQLSQYPSIAPTISTPNKTTMCTTVIYIHWQCTCSLSHRIHGREFWECVDYQRGEACTQEWRNGIYWWWLFMTEEQAYR